MMTYDGIQAQSYVQNNRTSLFRECSKSERRPAPLSHRDSKIGLNACLGQDKNIVQYPRCQFSIDTTTMSEQSYLLAQESWSQDGAVVVMDESQQQLMVIPIRFMREGHVRTFAYVYEQLSFCFEEEGHLIRMSSGEAVTHTDEVHPGRYLLVRSGEFL